MTIEEIVDTITVDDSEECPGFSSAERCDNQARVARKGLHLFGKARESLQKNQAGSKFIACMVSLYIRQVKKMFSNATIK